MRNNKTSKGVSKGILIEIGISADGRLRVVDDLGETGEPLSDEFVKALVKEFPDLKNEIAEANEKTAKHFAAQEEFLTTVDNLLDKIRAKKEVIGGQQDELDKLYDEVYDAQFTGTLPDSPLIKRLIS